MPGLALHVLEYPSLLCRRGDRCSIDAKKGRNARVFPVLDARGGLRKGSSFWRLLCRVTTSSRAAAPTCRIRYKVHARFFKRKERKTERMVKIKVRAGVSTTQGIIKRVLKKVKIEGIS